MRTCCAALAILLLLSPTGSHAQEPQDLARKAVAILKTHCYRCHGEDGKSEGGFGYATDARLLVGRKRIVPGDPGKSKLLKRMLNADDPMPPSEEKVRPSTDELTLLKKWIEAGVPAPDERTPRSFVKPEKILKAMRDDLEKAGVRDRPFLRYFTLTHLYNADLSAEEIQSYRHGVSKLINSLSWSRRIVVPVEVGPAKTLLRIDLRDYEWNERTWDTILARNPYGINYASADAKACAEMTRSPMPYVRGDWFVAVGSRPPLYHDILQLPRSEQELEKLLRIDTTESIRQEKAARAGFNSSGVSRNNRLIERHESGATVYWKSYDFAGNTGRQNLFALPLGPGDSAETFAHDGGEIIISLPNGLQAYFLADAKGQRIDKGPTAIVSDPRRPDRAVENGLSCISCHSRGIIDKSDQIRGHVLKNSKSYAEGTLETLLALYPPSAKMSALMRADSKRFQDAVAKTGAPLSTTEPITALTLRFEAELDLALAAAEAGVPTGVFLKALDTQRSLAKELGPLRVEGGTVQRQVFVDCFGELTEALKQGTFSGSKNQAAEKLLRQAGPLLTSDAEQALRLYRQATEADPENALAHAGLGDAHRLLGDHSDAIAAYTEALRLDPRSAGVLNSRGLMLHRLGKHDKALADFTAAIRIEPRFGVAYLNRGVVHSAIGEHDRAIEDYTEALRYDPKSALLLNNRGYAHLEKNDPDRAIADFDQAVTLDPKFSAAFNNRGLAHLRKKRLESAIADFSTAIRLNPKFALAYYNRGVAYMRQGDTARAAEDQRRAEQLDANLTKD